MADRGETALLPAGAVRSDDPNEQAGLASKPASTRSILTAVFAVSTCCMALAAVVLFTFFPSEEPTVLPAAWLTMDSGMRRAPTPSLAQTAPRAVENPTPASCAVYDSRSGTFAGVQYTVTDEGEFVMAEAEEGEAASSAIDSPFGPTFFDFDCLLANGTGDPCDAHVAEAYVDQIFLPLRINRLVSLWVSTVLLFSLAQIGGIPRPKGAGVFFWVAWVLTQACQLVVVGLSVAMQVVAFLGVRARLAPCLIKVAESTLLDEYAMITFAAQPALLAGLLLLVVYAYLLSLGLLVFIGREKSKHEFVQEATSPNGGLTQPIPLAGSFYFLSRCVLYGICLSVFGLWLGVIGLTTGWLLALAAAATGWLTGGLRPDSHEENVDQTRIAFYALVALLLLPTFAGLAYLPLAGLFIGTVKLSFAAGRWLVHIVDKLLPAPQDGRRRPWLNKALQKAAASCKSAIGWIAPLETFKLTNGMSMTVQGLEYTETSWSTLAGGMACVLGSLTLSPLVAYGTWASEHSRLDPLYDVDGSAVEAIQAWVWVPWLLLPVAVLVCYQRCRVVTVGCFLLLFLPALIFFTFLTDSHIERIIRHVQVCYTDSLAALGMLSLDWSGLQPFINSVVEFGAEFLGDPWGAMQDVVDCFIEIANHPWAPVLEVIESFAKISRYIEIDPSYFVEKAAALDVLNAALGLLKLLATYGRKLFAIGDALRGLQRGDDENEEGDGTLQVRECVAEPGRAKHTVDMDPVFKKVGMTPKEAEEATELVWVKKRLNQEDAALIANWLNSNTKLECLYLQGNEIGSQGAAALSEGLKGNLTLKELNLAGNAICGLTTDYRGEQQGTYTGEGITKLCEGLKGSAVTSLNVLNNSLGDGADTLVAAAREMPQLITLCGIQPEQEDVDFSHQSLYAGDAKLLAFDLSKNQMIKILNLKYNLLGPEGGAALAEGLKGNSKLQVLDLNGNNIGPEGGKALAESLKGNLTLTSLSVDGHGLQIDELKGTKPTEKIDLSNKELGIASTIIIASCIKENSVLKELNLYDNKLCPKGGAALAEGLKGNSTLQSLNVDGHALQIHELKGTKPTEKINLSGNRLGVPSAIIIASCIKENSALKELYLDGNGLCIDENSNFTDKGITALCEGLKGSALTSLSLAGNQLCGVNEYGGGKYTTEGISALCEGIKGSALTSLDVDGHGLQIDELRGTKPTEKIDLSGKGLGVASAIIITSCIKKNSVLKELNLALNRIGDEGVFAIAAVLKETEIIDLNLTLNQIGDEGVTKLAEVLSQTKITNLNLEYNYLGPKGGAALAEGLKGNLTLQSLNLRSNGIGPEGGAALAEGLKGNSTLRSLNLFHNEIGAEGASALAAVLKETKITDLNLQYNNLDDKAEQDVKDAAGSGIHIEF